MLCRLATVEIHLLKSSSESYFLPLTKEFPFGRNFRKDDVTSGTWMPDDSYKSGATFTVHLFVNRHIFASAVMAIQICGRYFNSSFD